MDIVCLRHLAYVLMPAVTVFWGESLRARFLQRGARLAIFASLEVHGRACCAGYG